MVVHVVLQVIPTLKRDQDELTDSRGDRLLNHTRGNEVFKLISCGIIIMFLK